VVSATVSPPVGSVRDTVGGVFPFIAICAAAQPSEAFVEKAQAPVAPAVVASLVAITIPASVIEVLWFAVQPEVVTE